MRAEPVTVHQHVGGVRAQEQLISTEALGTFRKVCTFSAIIIIIIILAV